MAKRIIGFLFGLALGLAPGIFAWRETEAIQFLIIGGFLGLVFGLVFAGVGRHRRGGRHGRSGLSGPYDGYGGDSSDGGSSGGGGSDGGGGGGGDGG